jgi:hypothetical protein
MGKISESRAAMTALQEQANSAAVKSIRAIEQELREELAGKVILGLPNLSHSSTQPFRGIQVRTRRADTPLPRVKYGEARGREVLCWGLDGSLVMACALADGTVDSRPLADDEIRAEDLESVLEAFVALSAAYLRASENRQGRYGRILGLAKAIDAVLEEEA